MCVWGGATLFKILLRGAELVRKVFLSWILKIQTETKPEAFQS